MQRRPSGGSRPALTVAVAAVLLLGAATPAAAAAAPALSSVAPTSAPVGAVVSLAGTGLAGVTSVTFNGATATFQPNGDGQLFATVPTAATDGPVAVVSPDGTATMPFDVDEAPGAVTGLTARGGESVIRLRWTAPADATGVVVRRAEGSTAPASTTDGTEVTAGGSGLTDTGLVNGRTYSYAVWAKDSSGSLSPAAVVSAVPAPAAVAALRIGLSAASVVSGAYVTVTGVLSDPGGTGLAGEGVTLLRRLRGATSYAGTASAVTDSAGVARFTFRVLQHTDLMLQHAGDAFSTAATSPVAPISARHGLTSRLVRPVIELGGTALVEGRIGPAASGVQVRLERRLGTAWHYTASTATDFRGGFRFAVRPPAGGEQLLRVVTAGTATHDAAAGAPLRLAVLARTLRAGMSGADVLALERRLTELRYDVGPMTGTYDYDTRLAVMAFQKVQDLPRTGVADAATRSRLGTPIAPRLRRPLVGLSVEIDLTRQVLLYARDGVVQRILPVSSGNNELYTVDGVTSRAVTPVGSFRVQRKINGVRVSRLGQLFQPAYFVGGYAIHGSPSVPGYPASHGCIRVTQSGMGRLFPLLPVGTPVTIYYS